MNTIRGRWAWTLITPLLMLTGCDAHPSAPALEGNEAEPLIDEALALVVQTEGDGLLLRVKLEEWAEDWRERSSGNPEVTQLLFLAGALRAEAEAARSEGQVDVADILELEAETFVFRAGLALLGSSLATEATLAAHRVLVRLQETAAAGRPSASARHRLDRASSLVAQAIGALSAGDDLQALGAGVEAAEVMAGLSPEQTAKRWIGHATVLLDRAMRLAGPSPEPPISAWLQAAEQMLSQAVSSFQAGNFQAATQQAKASAQKSRKVLAALSGNGGVDPASVAERAIAMAEQLLDRAQTMAGPEPRPEIQGALEDARSLLGEAKAAFAAGSFSEAARLARESAAVSTWVIRQLSGGPPALDPLEAAERAILRAAELLDRATQKAGELPRPEIADALARAGALLSEARAAFDAGDYREAVRLARKSAELSSWVLRQLSG
jgi:tetratricopeptide (TPR) repeat protein